MKKTMPPKALIWSGNSPDFGLTVGAGDGAVLATGAIEGDGVGVAVGIGVTDGVGEGAGVAVEALRYGGNIKLPPPPPPPPPPKRGGVGGGVGAGVGVGVGSGSPRIEKVPFLADAVPTA
jgi:hypothetical protein